MDETEIQIADEAGAPEPSAEAPYRNLWIPLVAVPAAVVIAMVIVVALLGSLAGEERSMSENLELVESGGKNQREQALFGLVRQAIENLEARKLEKDLPWPVEPGFAKRATKIVQGLDEDEVMARLALSAALAGMDPRGVDLLLELLELSEAQDPDGKVRVTAVFNLGLLGDERASRPLIDLLDDQDKGLRLAAAGALGLLGGPGVREALVGTLADSKLEVRGTAALSLSKLVPPAHEAAGVLVELTDLASYEAVNAQDPSQYARASDVSTFRILALAALARLGRADDWAHIDSLRGDQDANVVDAVLRLLRDREEQ